MVPGTVPYTLRGIVLCNRPDTNSIVGTDIFLYSIVGTVNSHTIRPPTCLWASTVLWAPAFTVSSEHGETPHMPLGIKQYSRYQHLPYPKQDDVTSNIQLTSNSVVGAYHPPVPAGVGNKT